MTFFCFGRQAHQDDDSPINLARESRRLKRTEEKEARRAKRTEEKEAKRAKRAEEQEASLARSEAILDEFKKKYYLRKEFRQAKRIKDPSERIKAQNRVIEESIAMEGYDSTLTLRFGIRQLDFLFKLKQYEKMEGLAKHFLMHRPRDMSTDIKPDWAIMMCCYGTALQEQYQFADAEIFHEAALGWVRMFKYWSSREDEAIDRLVYWLSICLAVRGKRSKKRFLKKKHYDSIRRQERAHGKISKRLKRIPDRYREEAEDDRDNDYFGEYDDDGPFTDVWLHCKGPELIMRPMRPANSTSHLPYRGRDVLCEVPPPEPPPPTPVSSSSHLPDFGLNIPRRMPAMETRNPSTLSLQTI